MTKELSILIPCYNYICTPLAEQLARQAASIKGLQYELIVIDDGSTETKMVEVNKAISKMAYCRHICLPHNVGRAKVRNMLVDEAKYELLLFVDCKHCLPDAQFVRRYIEASDNDVVDGGIRIDGDRKLLHGNLRFIYEKSAEEAHSVEKRIKDEYRDFHTANFMVRKRVMDMCRFDESITRYGYEDVLFGKQLKCHGIHITHINNPVSFSHFESNRLFVAKTEEGMLTLRKHSDKLVGYSTLLDTYNNLKNMSLLWIMRISYRLFGKLMRNNLVGKHPNLIIFKIYKLLYFSSLP